MFNSKKELALALMEGRKFKTSVGMKLHYNDTYMNPFRCGGDSMNTTWEEYGEVTEIKEWYEEPFKPCLCWVKASTGDKDIVRVIGNYNKETGYFETVAGGGWKYAAPMTKDEVLNLCWAAES